MKIHIDIDAFFVSAERTVNPKLLKRPVAVGGRGDPYIFSAHNSMPRISLDNSGAFVPTLTSDIKPSSSLYDRTFFIDPDGKIRGILTTASYEARALGIKTPMPIAQALRLVPELIVLAPNFKLYHKLSKALRLFLEHRVPILEQFSIDEFFADLNGWVEPSKIPRFIEELKEEIYEHFALPVSIGAAQSKWIAKLATNAAKPYGTYTVYPKNHDAFVYPMPIGKFVGIGRKLKQKLHAQGFQSLGDIAKAEAYFKKQTPSLYHLWKKVCGIDKDRVTPPKARQSIGVSRTFDPIINREEIKRRLTILCRHLSFSVIQAGVNPTKFHLSIRYVPRAKAKAEHRHNRLFSEQALYHAIIKLFEAADTYSMHHIISLSISVGAFSHQTKKSLNLFYLKEDQKAHTLSKESARMRQKYGLDILRWGNELKSS